jgi:hypothetical protein
MKPAKAIALYLSIAVTQLAVIAFCVWQLWEFSAHPVWQQVLNALCIPISATNVWKSATTCKAALDCIRAYRDLERVLAHVNKVIEKGGQHDTRG